MSENARLADQVRRAFEGEAWHGDSVLELLRDVNPRMAAAKPIPNAHSIWELLLHIAAWDRTVIRRAGGATVNLSDAENFPRVEDTSETAWKKTVESVKKMHEELVKSVSAFPDA